jgi:hypothetical protein
MMKAKIFIGSSREAVSAARIVSKWFVQKRFKGCYQVACWNDTKQGVFPPTEFGLESLMGAAHDYKFGIFVFAADDLAAIRNSIQLVTRDNVVFECGMFFGRLGRHRTFLLVPRHIEFHVPSDLAGLNVAYYQAGNRGIAAACSAIEKKIREQLHKHESPSLSGKWHQTWRVPDTGSFQGPNGPQPTCCTLMTSFLLIVMINVSLFRFAELLRRGSLPGRGITYGAWAIFGAFQLRIHPMGHRLKGVLVGSVKQARLLRGRGFGNALEQQRKTRIRNERFQERRKHPRACQKEAHAETAASQYAARKCSRLSCLGQAQRKRSLVGISKLLRRVSRIGLYQGTASAVP